MCIRDRREITHQHAGYATPAAMASRADLAHTLGSLRASLTAGVDLAHVTRDAPVSYTHLDVYKRQPFVILSHRGTPALSHGGTVSIKYLWGRRVSGPDPAPGRGARCLLYTSRCV